VHATLVDEEGPSDRDGLIEARAGVDANECFLEWERCRRLSSGGCRKQGEHEDRSERRERERMLTIPPPFATPELPEIILSGHEAVKRRVPPRFNISRDSPPACYGPLLLPTERREHNMSLVVLRQAPALDLSS
jgi:hypothetical protein